VSGDRFIAWVPNLISLARLLSVPVAVYVILLGYYGAAFWIFLAAGISDAVDGLIAKHCCFRP
jgi:cardiolipin synthase